MSDSLRPMDCGPPDSSVHGILQARILELVAISFSRGSSWPGDWTQVSCIAGLYWLSHQGLNSNSEFTVLRVHWDRTADARMWTQTLIVCLKITLILENPQSFTSVSCLPVFQCVSPTVMEEVGREWKINQERSEHVSEDWKEVRMEEKMSLSGIEREQKKKKKAAGFVVVQPLSHVQLCDPMDSSTPGSPVLHYLLEFAQIHVPGLCFSYLSAIISSFTSKKKMKLWERR